MRRENIWKIFDVVDKSGISCDLKGNLKYKDDDLGENIGDLFKKNKESVEKTAKDILILIDEWERREEAFWKSKEKRNEDI